MEDTVYDTILDPVMGKLWQEFNLIMQSENAVYSCGSTTVPSQRNFCGKRYNGIVVPLACVLAYESPTVLDYLKSQSIFCIASTRIFHLSSVPSQQSLTQLHAPLSSVVLFYMSHLLEKVRMYPHK